MNAGIIALLFMGGLVLTIAVVVWVGWPRQRPDGTASPAGKTNRLAGPTKNLPYARIPTVLTQAEQSFYSVLRSAAPADLAIFPQVRLANLVQTTSRGRNQKYDFYRIQAKCVDFVLCDPATTLPRLVIELDDASHNRADRQERDAFVDAVLTQVGIPVLHVRWQPTYQAQDLADQITGQLGRSRHLPAPPPQAATVAQSMPARPAVRAALPARLPSTPAYQPPKVHAEDAPVAAMHVVEAPALELTWACGQCQRSIHKDARFCPHCGAVLTPKHEPA